MIASNPFALSLVSQATDALTADLAAIFPRLLSGLLFIAIAGAAVQLLLWAVLRLLRRALPDASPVYRRFVMVVIGLFLWFGIALAFLSIVGLPGIAASLGTASGFVALGVAYALSGMLADAVAGVYLLRDPDFTPGDEVTVGDMTGVVRSIELRKTRFDVEGGTVVRGNAEIEKRWTRKS